MSVKNELSGQPFNILFVCLGNLCRSPMAEGIARGVIEDEYPDMAHEVRVSSAGVAAMDGGPATNEAVLAMSERGIDISGHRARRVTTSMVASSDLVLAMEERHAQSMLLTGATRPVYVLMRLGEAAGVELRSDIEPISGRLVRLEGIADAMQREGLWALQDNEYDVPDPLGLPVHGYAEVAGLMERSIRDILRVLLEGLQQAR
jgi:protein-tyrosine-phosphatase